MAFGLIIVYILHIFYMIVKIVIKLKEKKFFTKTEENIFVFMGKNIDFGVILDIVFSSVFDFLEKLQSSFEKTY